MKTERTLIALTVVNVAAAVLTHAGMPRVAAQGTTPVVRGRAFELVDDQGQVRASLAIVPATSAPGHPRREKVMLQLITDRGRPSVKIAASEDGSGLSFAGPTGTRDTYVILESNGNVSSLKLRNENRREQVVTP